MLERFDRWRGRLFRRNQPQPNPEIPEELPAFEIEEVSHIDLQLFEAPLCDHLAVLIQDPEQPDKFWFRKMKVRRDTQQTTSKTKLPHIDITHYQFTDMQLIPVPASELEVAVQYLIEGEQSLAHAPDTNVRAIQAVVGVARYTGSTAQTVDSLATLTAYKYESMRTTAQN